MQKKGKTKWFCFYNMYKEPLAIYMPLWVVTHETEVAQLAVNSECALWHMG
jgi:hypothetical protein